MTTSTSTQSSALGEAADLSMETVIHEHSDDPFELSDDCTDIEEGSCLYDAVINVVHEELSRLSWILSKDSTAAKQIMDSLLSRTKRHDLASQIYDIIRPLNVRRNVFVRGDGKAFGNGLIEKICETKLDFLKASTVGDARKCLPQLLPPGLRHETPCACVRPSPEKPVADVASQTEPLRFLDLPREIREWVYRMILVPGTIMFKSCSHHNPLRTYSTANTAILTTCKQIHSEAKGLLFENRFVMDLFMDSSSRPVIHSRLVPLHALHEVKHVELIVDATVSTGKFSDWRPVQRMTKIRSAQVLTISNAMGSASDDDLDKIVLTVCENLPDSCDVTYRPWIEIVSDTEYSKCTLRQCQLECDEDLLDADLDDMREEESGKLSKGKKDKCRQSKALQTGSKRTGSCFLTGLTAQK